jgi:luciferase family oxidoreductase group 1
LFVTDAQTTDRQGDPGATDPADQIRGTARGRADVPLSILDLAPIGAGYSPTEALATTTELARRAEAWGYHRFWVAEHHGMPGIASSAPAVLLAHLGAATSTIRLGSGGVMLPNHAPLVVAEQFGLLHALHPGRIDLGLGRAPGTDQVTASALNRPESADEFPRHVTELAGFLDASFPPGHRYSGVRAVPGRSVAPDGGRPPIWLLGSSGFSAQLAGMLGLPFAFAHHFSAGNTIPALELYHDAFRPSDVLDKPYALIGVGAIAADSEQEARYLAGSAALSMLRLRRGTPGPVPTPQEAAAYPYSAVERDFVESWTGNVILGDPDQVRDGLTALRARTGADELMITGMVHGREERLRSFELIAGAHGLLDGAPGDGAGGQAV